MSNACGTSASAPARLRFIGQRPLLEAVRADVEQPRLVLYGRPGTNYTIETTDSLGEPARWRTESSVVVSRKVL